MGTNNEEYIRGCVERQAAKEAVLVDAEPVILTGHERERCAAYLRYQARLAREAFAQGEVPPGGSMARTLADGVHDAWVAAKARDGWRYAATRDDAAKLHNLMVPPSGLTFEQFRWDIDTAASTMLGVAQALDAR